MAGRLSYSIAINLLTENFRKGTKSVKDSFRSMQAQIVTFAAALGVGGFGLMGFITRLKDVARETNRVITALKNVSGGTVAFADNLKYINGLANKYGLEVNGLIDSFTKFTASATQANMPMEQQRKVFESVSRAISAFSLSSDEGKGVMLALSQMMGKGKISMEELRKQMGEKLPIAMQAMANALGVSIAEMEKLIGTGKIMSADILPKFADALNEMIPEIDTDNLETSINRLQNAFGDFVNASGFENKYKALIDGFTSLIGSAAKNIQNVILGIVAVITFFIIASLTKVWQGYASTGQKIIANAQTTHNKLRAAIAARVEAERKLNALIVQQAQATGRQQISIANQVSKAQQALAARTAAVHKAHENAKAAAAQAAALKSMGAWGTFSLAIKGTFFKLANSLKAMWNSFSPAIIVTAIIALLGYFKSIYDETKRIKNIFSEYRKEVESSEGDTQEIKMLQAQLAIINDKKAGVDKISNAEAQLRKMLGLEKKDQRDLNNLVATRIELLKATAKANLLAQKSADSELRINQLRNEVTDINNKDVGVFKSKFLNPMVAGKEYAINIREKEIEQLEKVIADAETELENTIAITNDLNKSFSSSSNDNTDTSKKQSELEKQQEKYTQSLRELDTQAQLYKETSGKAGLSLQEYNKALDDLNTKSWVEAKASNDKKILESEYLKGLDKKIKNLRFSEDKEKEYRDKLDILNNQLDAEFISSDEYADQKKDLIRSTMELIASNLGAAARQDKFYNTLSSDYAGLIKPVKPDAPEKTSLKQTYAYQLEADEILDKGDISSLLADLKASATNSSKELLNELNKALDKTNDLPTALKIAQAKIQVKELQKELNEGLYSGVKTIMSGADGVVSAFERLNEVLSDTDASGWERIMALWSAMTSTVDAFLSIVDAIEKMTMLTEMLTKAKETEATMDTITTGQKVANIGTETTAATTALATETAAQVAASKASSIAAATDMAAKSTAAYASIPFAGVGLAAAQIASMQALIVSASTAMAAIPAFANGGIIQGSPMGDLNLARVNGGEMILNGSQQKTLFNLLNGAGSIKTVDGGGEVKFIIEGSRLVGVLDSYGRKKNRMG